VRDAVETVLRLLPDSEPMSFRVLAAGVPSRLEFVVRFLAVLELYKQGTVELHQVTTFGQLDIEWVGDSAAVIDSSLMSDVDTYDG
jgi:segregation and condensation protein A